MNRLFLSASLTCVVLLTAACSSTYKKAESGELGEIRQNAGQTLERYRQTDPTLTDFFDSAAGYAIFPSVKKGAAGVGAAHGTGVVYSHGQIQGYATLSQASIGLQLGGQTYSELIFFQNDQYLQSFKSGDFEFSAQASAVAAKSGAGANADYQNGVAVFTMGETGLMFEASVGGQKFSYTPASSLPQE